MTDLTIALLGSGEFEPWSEDVDRALLARARPGRVLILPTASAPEGDAVFEDWGARGQAHYAHLGLEAEVVPLKTRADAEDQRLCAKIDDAGVVFFSGGNPAYLADTLRATPFWQALVRALSAGAAYAGCSAGAMLLGEAAVDSTATEFSAAAWRPGIGFLRGVWVAPHWDALDADVPGLRDFIAGSVANDHTLLTLDENTAIVGDGDTWSVLGRGAAGLPFAEDAPSFSGRAVVLNPAPSARCAGLSSPA